MIDLVAVSLREELRQWVCSSPTTAPAVSSTAAFDVLRNERRRLIIRVLDCSGAMRLGELARRVAALEEGYDTLPVGQAALDTVTAAEYKRVYTALYQTHLPRLDKLDVIAVTDTDRVIPEIPVGVFVEVFAEIEARFGTEVA